MLRQVCQVVWSITVLYRLRNAPPLSNSQSRKTAAELCMLDINSNSVHAAQGSTRVAVVVKASDPGDRLGGDGKPRLPSMQRMIFSPLYGLQHLAAAHFHIIINICLLD